MLVNAYKPQHPCFLLSNYIESGSDNVHLRLEDIPFDVSHKFNFCFVRNPWKQRVSWLKYSVRKGACPEGATLRQFLEKRPRFSISQYLYSLDMDAIYQNEKFDEAIDDLQLKLDIKLQPIRVAVAPETYDYTTFYDEELIERVRNKEQKLLAMFPYKFGNDI